MSGASVNTSRVGPLQASAVGPDRVVIPNCAGQAKLDGLLAYPGARWVAAALVVVEQSLPWVRCVLGCHLVREIPPALARTDPADAQHSLGRRFSECGRATGDRADPEVCRPLASR